MATARTGAWLLRSLAPALLVAASSARAGGAGDSTERQVFTFAPTRAALVLITGAGAAQALADHRPGKVDAASAAEAELLRECAAGETQRALAQKGFLWAVAVQAWRVFLHPFAVSVRDELLKYASVSSASASGDYYRAGEPAASTALNERISCLRFTRYAATGSGSDDVALDFVASVRLDTPRDAIRLRPLRLFIDQAGAKSANGRYAVAIAVRARAVWRDEFAGHSDQVFDENVASEAVDLKGGSFLKYYPTDPASGTREPIVPISFGSDRSRDFGRVEFAVSVAELGAPPATLTLLAQLLPTPDENIAKVLVSAAIAGIRLQ